MIIILEIIKLEEKIEKIENTYEITITNHGFETGDVVYYTRGNNKDTILSRNIDSDDTKLFIVKKLTDHTLNLSTNYPNAKHTLIDYTAVNKVIETTTTANIINDSSATNNSNSIIFNQTNSILIEYSSSDLFITYRTIT